MNKILRYSLSLVLALVASVGFAETYTYTFENKVFSAKDETKDLGGINWTVITDTEYFGFDSSTYKKGQQFGSKKKPATELTLSTSDIPGKISSIKVKTAGASGTNATLDVTVNGKAFGSQYNLALDLADATFTGSEEGKIVLSFKNSTATAIYISSIEVVTDGKLPSVTPSETPTVDNIAAFKAIGAGNKAILKLKDAQVQYVNGTNDMFIVDATGGIDIYQSELAYTAGQILNGTIEGTYDEFKALPELTSITASNITATDGTVTPVEMTVEEAAKAENACKLVTVKNIKLVGVQEGDYTNYYTDEDKTLQVYDKFKKGYKPDTEAAMDYTGILLPYNSRMELAPISAPVATGISHISADVDSADAPVYNLSGQRVGKNAKGVLIKNGKKYVVK